MEIVPVQKSLGMALCHDITEIIPGERKGRRFRKGHIIRDEDIPVLLNLGKENIYVWNLNEGYIHEDDAAIRISAVAAGKGLTLTEPCEGRINFKTKIKGLLKVDAKRLKEINSITEIVLATLHGNQVVNAEVPVAGTRVIPLVVKEEKIQQVEAICASEGAIVYVLPLRSLKIGLITTGSEVYHGRIKDGFGPILRQKFKELGCDSLEQVFVPDDMDMTAQAINDFISQGAELIAVTGGMSVDPDDRTPASIRHAGGKVISYGSPTFPGAMFMLAEIGTVPVVGLPGCVMYHHASIFDLVIPRLLAGEKVTREDIVSLGHGGFCAGCKECSYPRCSFGKGS